MNMPFGRYKGLPLEELPDDYLAWLAGRADLWEPLRHAVDTEQAQRLGRADFQIHTADRQIAKRIVEAGRRSLAKAEHPDRGGDVLVMQRVNMVADLLLEQLA
jgi:hypothetical protein